MNNSRLEKIWEAAIEAFPHKDLEPTGYTQGELAGKVDENVEYSEEFTFEVGTLLDDRLIAGGWIELFQWDTGLVTVNGLFSVCRNGDWDDGRILPEYTGVVAQYDLETMTWEMTIDQY